MVLGIPTLPFVRDQWELYNVVEDFGECRDLAAEYPDKVQELIGFGSLRQESTMSSRCTRTKRKVSVQNPIIAEIYMYYPGTSRIDNEAAVNVRMRPFSVVAEAVIPEGGAEGVLIAQGGRFAGWSLFVQDGKLIYEHNFVGLERYRVISELPSQPVRLAWECEFTITGQFEITPELTEWVFRVSKATLRFSLTISQSGPEISKRLCHSVGRSAVKGCAADLTARPRSVISTNHPSTLPASSSAL